MADWVVDICNHPDYRENFECLTDQEVRSALGISNIFSQGIYRWKSNARTIHPAKPKALHLFVELETPEIARAALKYRHDGWLCYPLCPNSALHHAYLSFKTTRGRDPVWGPGVTVQQASPVDSLIITNLAETTPPSLSPTSTRFDTPYRDVTPGVYYGGTTGQYNNEYQSKPRPIAPRLSYGQSFTPSYAPANPTQRRYSHHTYPSNSSSTTTFETTSPAPSASHLTRRSRDPDEVRYTPPPYKKQRRVESSRMESFELAQERLRCSELATRAQFAEETSTALQERVMKLEGEKEVLEVLERCAVDQAMQHAELKKHCEELERQLVKAVARAEEDREERERRDAEQVSREAELVSRCEMLEEELRLVRQNQLATLKEQEEMRRMVDSAYIVPSLQDAFVQIDQLFRGLIDTNRVQ